ncbi:MAG: hypothetical protein NTX25_10940 [Proteobacteria bacterium]|nr:hypothetical protein [Pseudomonadota bacterium]
MAMGWFKVSGWLQLLRLGFGSLLLSILGLSLVAPKAAEAQELQAELPFPSYSFSFPRLAYDVETDEVLVGNGSISAAMVSNGNDSYFASQLRRIHAPPFTLNNADQGTLVIWGYDELGWHASMNKKFKLDYNIREVKAFTTEPEFYGQTNPNWLVDFSYSALPGQRVILATVNYKNISSEPHPLQLSFALINPQITKSYNWDWWNPATSKISAQFQKSGPFGFVETQSRAQDAYLVFGLDKTVDSKAVTTQNEWQRWVDTGSYSGLNFVKNVNEHNQYLAHSFGLVQAGQTVSVTGIISIDGSASGAREHFLNAAGNLHKQLDGAESYWRQRWNNTKFEVLSPDDGINRMADLAMSNGIGAWDEINDSWVTAFSENARGANYLWDNNYAGYGFLFSNPPRVKSTLRKLLNLNWKTKYAYSIADGHSVGTYYAYNHNTLVELVYRYVLTSGDLAFLSERIQGQSVFDILLENLDYVDSSLNYNFGEMSNLLEVIPNYIHGVPDLIAATYKMAKEIEALALELGQTQQANLCLWNAQSSFL